MDRTALQRVVSSRETRAGLLFDWAMQALIVVSLAAFAIETLPGLSPATRRVLLVVEHASVALFVVEYLLRLYAAPSRLGYAASFFGVVDLVAVVPSLLGLGFDLRSVRALRLLRVFRVLKLARYSRAVRRLHLAIKIAWEELVLFGAMTAVLLFLAAVGIYECEHEAQPEAFASVFHGLWWAVVTLTTVGYGDAYPVTAGGRAFTLLVLLVGLGIVSIPPGLVASALSKARAIQDEQREQGHEEPQGVDTKQSAPRGP